MKKYSVFLKIDSYDETIEAQFKKAKKTFLKAIEGLVSDKKVILAKKQETELAIDLSVDDSDLDDLEKTLNLFRKIETVDIIDLEYIGPEEI